MTKDFRNVGRLSPGPENEPPPTSGVGPAPLNQRIILRTLQGSAAAFFLAGLWLLTGQPSPLPHSIAPIMGIAFIIAAAFDLAAVQIFKRAWAKHAGYGQEKP